MASRTPEHLAPRTLPNAKSPWATTEQERQHREKFGEAQLQVLRSLLVPLLQKLGRIPDPRRPTSVRHKLTLLLVYGMFLFVLQMASRREGNRELGRPGLWAALRAVFPELAEAVVPHADTVNRLLARIEPEQLERALREQIRALVRHRKLQGFLVRHHYVIAIDGQQRLGRDWCWAEEALHWRHGEDVRYTAYVLEAVLVCPLGITLPISAEFCANEPAPEETPEQATARKQDCERQGVPPPGRPAEAHLPAPEDPDCGRRPVPQRADHGALPALQVGLHVRAPRRQPAVGAEGPLRAS